MKEYLKEKFNILLIFFIFYFIVEIATFVWVGFKLLPSDIIIDLVIIYRLQIKQHVKYPNCLLQWNPSIKATLWEKQPLYKDRYYRCASPLFLPNLPLYKTHLPVEITLTSLQR